MSWKQKITRLKEQKIKKRDELITHLMDFADPAPEAFIEAMKSRYPGLPESYVEFLRTSDGIQLDMWHLAGSGQSDFVSVPKLEKRWKPFLEGSIPILELGSGRECFEVQLGPGACPIGEEPGGGVFLLATDGRIDLLPRENFTLERVASTFDDLLDEVFLGSRHLEWGGADSSEWWRLLMELGWAS